MAPHLPLAPRPVWLYRLDMDIETLTEAATDTLLLVAAHGGGVTRPLSASLLESALLASLIHGGLVERRGGAVALTLDGCDAVDAIRRARAA